MSNRFLKEEDAFIRSYAKGHSHKEITSALNNKFGTSYKTSKISNYVKYHKIPAGKKVYLTKEEKEFLRSYALGHSRVEITNALNEKFKKNIPVKVVNNYLCDNHITTGYIYGKKPTNRQKAIARDRNNKVNDYMNKVARKVIDYCIANEIGTLVVGYNETFQRNTNMGKKTNQNFVNIPYGQLRNKLEYLCELNGIVYVKQEESYTSKASFWDKDTIPVYNADNPKTYLFSGKRVHRGLYRTANGKTFHADVNGALNIMRKSSVVDVTILYSRGEVDTPIRIRIA